LIIDVALPRISRPAPASGNLAQRFDARRNHLTVMRLGLAMTVAVVHASAVGFGNQPVVGHVTVGELAVDAFFVLSGFLIAGSYLRLGSVPRYLWHRFLRIMPGFWVCLLVTATVFAPFMAWLQDRPPSSVFTADQESAWDYIVANAALLMRQFGIAGLPHGVPEPEVMDGSLWTLFYEAVCYVGILALAAVGGLRRRPVLTLGAIAAVWIVTAGNAAGLELLGQQRMLRFTLLFLLGTAAFIYARHIPVRGRLAAASLVLVVAGLYLLPDYRALAAPAFTYICLWLMVARPPRRMPRHDLSYGVYMYHWPIEQLLRLAGLDARGKPVFVLVSVTLCIAAAILSWFLVERPCLGLKEARWRGRRPATTPGQRVGRRGAG
jgi:peptidoglycan/LPS O-acetylase OafA/YrhL